MAVTPFHPTDLNNVHFLREKFFTGESELAALDSLPPSAYKVPKGSLYYGSFEVVWVLTTLPFRIVYSIFLRSISALLSCAYFEKMATSIGFIAQSSEVYIDNIIRQLFWGAKRIIPSCNTYAPDARYVTRVESIQRENLKDPKIREHLTKLYDKVTFNLEGGLCSGAVNWFNYLFLLGIYQKTRLVEDCADFREYMTAISQLFKDGQPIQAALLQSLFGVDETLLGIKETKFVVANERLKSHSDLVESLDALPNGLYHIRITGIHSLSLMKAPDEILVYDPNPGLLDIETTDGLASLIESYASTIGDKPIYFVYQELDRPSVITRIGRSISRMFG